MSEESERRVTTSALDAVTGRGIGIALICGAVSVDRLGALRRVTATIASGNNPKIRITAADAQTTALVKPSVRAGRSAAAFLGFMNITITT